MEERSTARPQRVLAKRLIQRPYLQDDDRRPDREHQGPGGKHLAEEDRNYCKP